MIENHGVYLKLNKLRLVLLEAIGQIVWES